MTFLKYRKDEKQLDDFSSIEWLTTQAVANHKEGKLEDAIAFYLEAIELDENQPAWVYGNAITLMTQIDHLSEGLKLREKALRIHSESDEIDRASGNVLDIKNITVECTKKDQKALSFNQNGLESRSTPKDIEDCVDLDISELRCKLMDSAIVNQFETLLEQVLINMENGLKIINTEALVQTLAEIKTDIHYLKTKLLNPSPEIVDPQTQKNIDLSQIIGSVKPTVIKCEMNQRIVGSGWHEAEENSRWTGPGTISSVVLPYPATGEYKFEMIVNNEALPGLLDSLKIIIDNKSLDFTVIRCEKSFPAIIEGKFIANDREKQSFLAIDLMIKQTVYPQGLDGADLRLIGLAVRKISLIPQ